MIREDLEKSTGYVLVFILSTEKLLVCFKQGVSLISLVF